MKLSLLIIVSLIFNNKLAAVDTIAIFYNLDIPQQEFAATDIKTALKSEGFVVEIKDLSKLSEDFNKKKVVITLEHN